MPYRIITHSGKAHIDEVLASVLVAIHKGEQPLEIIRMEYKTCVGRFCAGKYLGA